MDVEDGELRSARLEELRCVGRGGGLLDPEIDAGVAVEALALRGVDPGVDGVRLKVENEGRSLRSARFSTAAAARRKGKGGEDGRQQRDDHLHRGR